MSGKPKIEIEGVRHWYYDTRSKGTVEAISSADLVVHEREFLSIVGPSGCGKTTLLNMIAGLVKPTQGRVAIDGVDVNGIRPQGMGYMFAKDVLLPWRTVLKNVMLGLEFERTSNSRERAQEFINLVGLDGFEDKYPDQLSHGMRQRAALARTLVRDPQLMLMDEPFGALDAQTRLLMQNEFLRLWEAHQSTVVFITHDLVEALALSDRVVVFSARPGRIKSEYVVDLPRPRRVDELQSDPAFQALHHDVWQDLKVEAEEADEVASRHLHDARPMEEVR
jgi:NitT/TauT family transport system ATP-binding protein